MTFVQPYIVCFIYSKFQIRVLYLISAKIIHEKLSK